MKKKWRWIYLICLFLPYLAVLILGKAGFFKEPPPPAAPREETVSLWRHRQETLEEVPLSHYLWGVLAGEMPASYPEEALKAQAVASYSYLRHRMETMAAHPSAEFGHPGDVCDDPDHCKAYRTPAEASFLWGADWLESAQWKLQGAVDAVLGQVLLYDGKAANTVFHAISGGRTENAKDVWGAEVPYLSSVDSHWDREAKGFASEKEYSLSELQELLGQEDVTPGAVTLTEGGSVATMVLGDKPYTGRQLRTLLGLRSTRFTLTAKKETLLFQVSGYGHQVGMSQYGASVLAEEGYTYREILAYYYPGTHLDE